MAKKYLTSLDLSKNEIQNAVAQVLAAAPSSPSVGQFYYDSTAGRLKFRGASAWIDSTDRATHTGTQDWSTISGTPTTLSGYSISDALSNSQTSTQAGYFGSLHLYDTVSPSHYLKLSNTDNLTALRTLNLTVNDADRTISLSGNLTVSGAATISGTNTGDQTITLTGDVTGTGTGSFVATLKNTGTAGTYSKVTTDAQGRVTSGTTLSAADIPTLTASKISDFDTQVRNSRLDQMAAPTAPVSFGSQRITGLADGTTATDAATYGQLQAVLNGRQFKDAVRVATTANITSLAGGAPNVVDGVTLAANDRILVWFQTTPSQNGLYYVSVLGTGANGTWVRTTDADSTTTDSEVKTGMTVLVSEGTTYADKQFTLTTNGAITLGTTGLTFAQTGSGTTYSPGTGITIAGSTISVDTSVVARKVSANVGDGSSTNVTIAHGLGTTDIVVNVYEVATGATVECDVTRGSTSQVTLGFVIAPTLNQYRVVVTG